MSDDEIVKIRLTEIDARAVRRDRMTLDPDALEELKGSIRENGLRMPIEVFKKPEEDFQNGHYGLISGYRRLTALREIEAETPDIRYLYPNCFVRPTEDHFEAFRMMTRCICGSPKGKAC
ncbi:MAG: ParB N-terminal domain-containing protein [Pseudomonadota bacterium]